jgi:4,4'-diaponeurosporenoate glycosyltransferase
VQLVPSLADVIVFALGWVCGWLLLWRLPRTVRPGPGAARRPIAVVIPARDEAANLPSLLAHLQPQLRADDELVVVDDRSSDGTAEVAAQAGARVVPARELEPGWTGKTNACATGAEATSAPVLVFVDADVRAEPGLLDTLQSEQARRGGIVSVQPWHAVVRPYEHLSLLFNITALGGSGAFSPLRNHSRCRFAYGAVLAIDRQAYDGFGGHGHPRVRGAVAEDIALAHVAGRSTPFTGRPLASFRMYPGGVRQLVQGWTKNMAMGAANVPWWAGVLTFAWLWSLAGGPFASPLLYLASVVQVWVQGRRVGRFGLVSALLYPVLLVFFLVVFLRSVAFTAVGHAVLWRGRRVVTRARV